MTDNDEPVSPDVTDSAFETTGTDHITIWGSNAEDTIEFYRDLLGMPLVLRQPNLDDPDQTHLFFDTGDGTILTVFVSDDRPTNNGPQHIGTGTVHHLCFSIDPNQFETVMDKLNEREHRYNLFDRGIFLSLYTRDHNGLIIELTTDKLTYPKERRGEVLAKTQEIREADDSDYAETEHMKQALEELGIEYEENELPDAASGAAGL